MGELVNISLLGHSPKTCPKCGMENKKENKDCCNDIQVTVNSRDQHIPSHAVFLLANFDIIAGQIVFLVNVNLLERSAFRKFSCANAPPLKMLPLYLQLRNLRI